MASKHEVAVVIPAYNEESNLAGALISMSIQPELRSINPAIIVVDNGSTDSTPEIANSFAHGEPELNLHVLHEPEKGTGTACDTGFRYAIDELGASVIARIDSDSIAMVGWLAALNHRHQNNPRLNLLTGPVMPQTRGEGPVFTHFEFEVLPRIKTASRLARALFHFNFGWLYFAPGHNMSTTAEAYDAVGGFPRTDIIHESEDITYTRKIIEEYGFRYMGYDRRMIVATSQRRLRKMGLAKAARYYLTNNPNTRQRITGGNADFRTE